MSFIDRILGPGAPRRKGDPGEKENPGAAAEALAARWLERRGMRVLARNYRVRGGEVDLIGELAGTLVFVEVRLRRNSGFGGAAASITRRKQRRIILAARHWLAENNGFERPCRFDCVVLDGLDERRLEWIPDAFASDDDGG